jgi:AcrR family transcriptional regulator
MASAKIQDKEKAILAAAITVFAERGFWNTPTSLISKTAGVADGTLFNYFKTKDDLIIGLYLEIKREVAEILLAGFDSEPTARHKIYHIWSRYIDWSLANPQKFKVMNEIHASFPLSESVKAQSMEPFTEIGLIAQEGIARGEFYDYPVEYLAAMMDAISVMTIQHIRANSETKTDYKAIGFEILWRGVTR